MESPNGITQHLEGFLQSARKLEDALGEEKKRSQKIAQEYLATRTTLENAVRELQNRLIQRENKIQAVTQAYQNIQSVEAQLKNELRELSEREKKAATELNQYRTAWNEVLAREAHARATIMEHEKTKSILNERLNQMRTLEAKASEAHANAAIHSRHADTYQRELQSALIRIQSAETKYSQIQKELTAVSQSKRNADEEIARIEASMKERFRWELATEKERIRAELEKDAALDRERFREITRTQMRAEIERLAAPEKTAREAAEAEVARMQTLMQDADARRNQDVERARSRLLAITEENLGMKDELNRAVAAEASSTTAAVERADRAEKALATMKNETAMYQLESAQAQMKVEAFRKESNKTMLVERLRHDDEVRDLRMKIEELLDRGIYAEKAEKIPEGMRVYFASPVATVASIARSRRDSNVEDQAINSDESTSL